MALLFSTSGSRVEHGSAAALDDLHVAAFSGWAWVYRTADGGNQYILSKTVAYPSGWAFLVDNYTAEGQIRFLIFRSSTISEWTDFVSSTANVVALDTWTFIGFTFDPGASPRVKFYRGTLAVAAAEVSAYALSQAGTSATITDASTNLWVGSLYFATANVFKGRIQRGAIVTRALTADEMAGVWCSSQRSGDPFPHCNIANTTILFDYTTTSTVTDRSGNGNNGTVTTASTADGPLFRSALSSGGVG